MLQFVGFDGLAPQVVYGPARQSDEWRNRALAEWAQRLESIAEEHPIEVGMYG